jgi:hypothetical protein
MRRAGKLCAGLAAAMMIIAVLAMILAVELAARGQGFSVAQALSYPYPYRLTAAARGERIAWVFDVRGARNVWYC